LPSRSPANPAIQEGFLNEEFFTATRRKPLGKTPIAIQALLSVSTGYIVNYSALYNDLRKAFRRIAYPAWMFTKRTRSIKRH